MSRLPRLERLGAPPGGLDRAGLGRWGEDQILALCERHGYRLIARNLHVSGVELDLVLSLRRTLLVVEVKTARFEPETNLSRSQRERLMFAASKLPRAFRQRLPGAILLPPGLRPATAERVEVQLAALQLGDPVTVRFFEIE